MFEVRRLLPAEAEIYVALRREMLLDSPWAFLASPGQDRGSDVDRVRASLSEPFHAIVGVFENGRLVAAAGARREEALKRQHIVTVWGVYVTPRSRGRGHGRRVVAEAVRISKAWDGVAALELAVSENSPGARRLYESLGFVPWGVEPDCVRVDGRSYAETHMRLAL